MVDLRPCHIRELDNTCIIYIVYICGRCKHANRISPPGPPRGFGGVVCFDRFCRDNLARKAKTAIWCFKKSGFNKTNVGPLDIFWRWLFWSESDVCFCKQTPSQTQLGKNCKISNLCVSKRCVNFTL